jgi:transcriptional regulator with XRE-family HTH domain
MKLSQRLRESRKNKKLTLKDVSRRCGVSVAYLAQLETDKAFRPKLELLYKLAIYYDIQSDVLINEARKIPEDVYWKIVNNPRLVEVIRSHEV